MKIHQSESKGTWVILDDEYPDGDARNIRYETSSRGRALAWIDGYAAGVDDYGG